MIYLECPECGYRHKVKLIKGKEYLWHCYGDKMHWIPMAGMQRFECLGMMSLGGTPPIPPTVIHVNCYPYGPDHPFFDIDQYKRIQG